MRISQDRQAKYCDQRHRAVEFKVGDHIYLKVRPVKKVSRIKRMKMLSPRFVGPYEVLERIGEVAYKLALPEEMGGLHDVFHVSYLRGAVRDPNQVISTKDVLIESNLSISIMPVRIEDSRIQKLRNREICMVKVLWMNCGRQEYTWEREDELRGNEDYAFLFDSACQGTLLTLEFLHFSDSSDYLPWTVNAADERTKFTMNALMNAEQLVDGRGTHRRRMIPRQTFVVKSHASAAGFHNGAGSMTEKGASIAHAQESMVQESMATLIVASMNSFPSFTNNELENIPCCRTRERLCRQQALKELEEAKILRAQGLSDMAVNLAKYILQHHQIEDEASNIYRLIGKCSRTILDHYLKHSVEIAETSKRKDSTSTLRHCQSLFQLAHYTDSLFKSYEDRLASNEWQAALRLRKHKTKELEVLMRRLKSSTKAATCFVTAAIRAASFLLLSTVPQTLLF
ncbi:Serine/threonine-protein kinase ATM [Platanthera zijinensis]|uniref:Serine/threonine-protein kinase ATM n=1 Tax=Platanthera zijinensis TaxID=2320716 RepID=A0AAP0FTG6_9ASPA